MIECPDGWPFSSWLNLESLNVNTASDFQSDISVFYEKFFETVDSILNGFNAFSPPAVWAKIDFGFTASWWLGARVTRNIDRSRYAISIDAGTWWQLYLALTRLLSASPPVISPAPSVIDPIQVGERYSLPRLKANPKIGENPVDHLFGGVRSQPTIKINDQIQQNLYSTIIYAQAYLFLHELSHAWRGHLDFRKHESEVNRRSVSIETLLTQEYLADTDAMILGAHLVNYTASTRNLDISDRSERILSELRLWSFSVALVLLLLESFENVAVEGLRHPPAVDRMTLARVAVGGTPVGLAEIELESAMAAIDEGFSQVEEAWDRLGWIRKRDIDPDLRSIPARMARMQERLHEPT